MKHSKTSKKKSCKRLLKSCKRVVCMATLVRWSRDTLIHSGSPADSQSAPEQSDSEKEYISPTKSDQDWFQDDTSDNLGSEPGTPPSNSQKRRKKFNSRRNRPEDSQESDSPLASLENNKFDRFWGAKHKDKSQGFKKGGSFVRKFSSGEHNNPNTQWEIEIWIRWGLVAKMRPAGFSGYVPQILWEDTSQLQADLSPRVAE